ncbi:MAG: ferritin-like domain-containing protein [Solirubrobacteraceae bacterium]|nr:ferritin-like domain-containing protein [Patulibacter sp.]
MFDPKFQTPEEIFSFKLGTALSMEKTSLELLGTLQEKTNRDELRAAFAEHARETEQHITNVQQAFELLGEDASENTSPAVEGLAREGEHAIKKTDDTIVDAVLLDGARAVEHHEIAVYETLVDNARARGRDDVAALLQRNLDDERNAIKLVNELGSRIARQGYAVPSAA